MPKCKGPGNIKRVSSKPFCDCEKCKCHECPDILKLLSISLSDSNHKISKMENRGCQKTNTKKGKKKSSKKMTPKRPSILDILQERDACNCELVARAVKSDVHKNLNITDKQTEDSDE